MVGHKECGRKNLGRVLNDPDLTLTMVEDLHEGFCLVDDKENILYANRSLCDLVGFGPDEILEMNISSLVPADEFKELLLRTQKRRKGIKETYQTSVIRKDKDIRNVLITASPWIDKNKDYKGSFGLFLDITDKNELDEALRENEEKYRATVEQSAENIYIYDIEREEIVESNRAIQELLGYTEEEMKKIKVSDFIEHSPDNIKGKINEVLEKGHAIIGERIYRRKDGTPVNVEVSASHIGQGERSMLCVVSRDITEMKRYQERLIEERNRAEFYLDLIAHDMGNLLHGINNGLSVLKIVEDDKEKFGSTLEMVKELAERSTKLSEDIQTFSKIRDSEPVLRSIEIEHLIHRAFEKVEHEFPEINIKRMVDVQEGLRIRAEPYLEEVFYNIFHNSVKIQAERPEIGIRAWRDSGTAVIEIWDNSGGIPQELKKTLFQRYEQIDMKKHSGIGLTLVYMIIKRYGGDIRIEDHVVDERVKGAKFIIELP